MKRKFKIKTTSDVGYDVIDRILRIRLHQMQSNLKSSAVRGGLTRSLVFATEFDIEFPEDSEDFMEEEIGEWILEGIRDPIVSLVVEIEPLPDDYDVVSQSPGIERP